MALEEETDRAPIRREAPKQEKPPVTPREPQPLEAFQKAATQQAARGNDRAIEEKLENLQSLLEKQLRPAEEEKKEKEPEEIEEEKDETVAFMQLLYNTMLENEVDEKYANQIIDEIEKNSKANIPMDAILSNVYQKMILKFGKPMHQRFLR